jgi:S-formylglutathione hydrolase FrmB
MLRSLGFTVLLTSVGVAWCGAGEDNPSTPPAAAPSKPAAAASKMEYITVESKALDAKIRVGIYLPAAYVTKPDAKFPCLYFLHGMFGDERKWEQRETDLVLDELIEKGEVPPMIVACPAGHNSMYVNWVNGQGQWMDFVTTDLVKELEAKYRIDGRREMRGISGDSMGGYGALNIAFQHSELYGSASAHSAALFPADPTQVNPRLKRWAKQWGEVFGDPIDLAFWQKNNPIHMATTLDEATLKTMAIYFDCGERDEFGFDKTSTLLHDALDKRKIPHTYELRGGDHGATYFRDNVAHSLRFHGDVFTRAQQAKKDG